MTHINLPSDTKEGLLPRRKFTDSELNDWTMYIRQAANSANAELSSADYIKKADVPHPLMTHAA